MASPGSSILITGGAGYIGSHTVQRLHRAGEAVVVLDNLCCGHREAVLPDVPFFQGDIADARLVREILGTHRVDSIIHFAAHAYVGESVAEPLKYYDNNVGGTAALLRTALETGCGQFVFSSTCATYGIPDRLPISEETPQRPINPYGRSKLMVEQMLRDAGDGGRLKWAALRYFNAAGASEDGSLGEDHDPETHLIPNAIRAVQGELSALPLFGDDYETPDGTCVRDYIHVLDLANAHESALHYLRAGGASLACNLGTGRGSSVREILSAVEEVTGRPVPVSLEPRRPGDPPVLVADAARARRELGWAPAWTEIRDTVRTAWNWFDGPGKGRFGASQVGR